MSFMSAKADRDPSTPGLFAYEAITPSGVRIKGPKARMNAYTVADVRRELMDQGFIPIKIHEVSTSRTALTGNIGGSGALKLKPLQVAAFSRGLYQLLRAGISLPKAILSLGEDADDALLTDACNDIATKIQNGTSVSEAFGGYPKAFDDVFCGYLAAGEQTGSLVASTKRLTELTEKRAQLHSKVKAVSIYPILVSSVIGVLVSGIILFLVPMYQKIYGQFKAKLPAPTLLLVGISHHFLPITMYGSIPGPDPFSPLFWGILIFVSLKIFIKVKGGEPAIGEKIDRVRFKLPLFGKLTRYLTLFRWVSTLSGALDAGVHTTQALAMASRSSGSRWVRAITPLLENGLQAGRPLSQMLAEYPDLFPSNIRTMVSTGEAAGELSAMLDSVSNTLSDEIDAIVAGLGAKIEVFLIVSMGIVVGGMLMALYLPILNLASTVAGSGGGSPAGIPTTTTTTLGH